MNNNSFNRINFPHIDSFKPFLNILLENQQFLSDRLTKVALLCETVLTEADPADHVGMVRY